MCSTASQQIVFQEYVRAVSKKVERVERIDLELKEQIATWRLNPVVEAVQAMRGVSFVVVTTIVSELGDITRFQKPSQLMCYLGLTP